MGNNESAPAGQAAPYERERRVAVKAVYQACKVTKEVFTSLVTAETLSKKDTSPVTAADFSAQALINTVLKAAFPDDRVISEEEASDLKSPETKELKDKVVSLVQSVGVGKNLDEAGVLDAIDHGDHGSKGAVESTRFWTIDPVDGTKGFLRGEQYAVCLALIENGEVVLGVLGCPNLPFQDGVGCMLVAVKGQGSFIRALTVGAQETPIHVTDVAEGRNANFTESVEAGHSSHSDSARIAQILGVTQEPVRMDSQCKYAAIASGDASIYLRLPTRAGYEEKIWDHAAGYLIVREAGGEVTDIHGTPLNFAVGRTLRDNRGVVATNGRLHGEVIAAVQAVLAPHAAKFTVIVRKEGITAEEVAAAVEKELGLQKGLVHVSKQ
mmetsp:Transcript_14198/g.36276  ORF Transcript_14198/g.36276 Transcript_14198/m.36276 type:complete len:382 (-) Transcript_14198:52-1197(-)|eukprot:CAMPEP_0177650144 /NCGR_PEP_ID=MMETSP0447-20121125/11772_1 /TAXON_ID=0 /ORGANISM="Stygamoeba regulata, Strain BSH-02190019" /LENGTH=381 /DNA_ID=CAMNT_0019152967 /DNA_START=118 /DNA_END=1263 /DNA_ORIENTATION=+